MKYNMNENITYNRCFARKLICKFDHCVYEKRMNGPPPPRRIRRWMKLNPNAVLSELRSNSNFPPKLKDL